MKLKLTFSFVRFSLCSPTTVFSDDDDIDGVGTLRLGEAPPEILSRVFKELRTRDMGRMLRVSQDFNHILTTNPTLWRVVDLERNGRGGNEINTIKVFASRSRNTLEVVRALSLELWKDEEKGKEFYSLLEPSRSTLRQLIVDSVGSTFLKLVSSFPNLQHLEFGGGRFPSSVEDHLPKGKLGILAVETLSGLGSWSSSELSRFSSLQFLHLNRYSWKEGSLQTLLQVCKSSLVYLSIQDLDDTKDLLEDDFPNLEVLCFDPDGYIYGILSHRLPKLRSIRGGGILLSGCPYLREVESISFFMNGVYKTNLNNELHMEKETLDCMIKVCSWSNDTLKQIKFHESFVTDQYQYPLDLILHALRVDFFEILCPSLSEIYIGEYQNYDMELLAECMISRNFAANGGKIEDEEVVKCSKVTIFFESSFELKEFQEKEQKMLSGSTKSLQKRAGISDVKSWDGGWWDAPWK